MATAGLSFHYLDSTGQEFGPFPAETLKDWFSQGLFPVGGDLPVRLPAWKTHVPLRSCYPDLTKAFATAPAINDPSEAKTDAAPTYSGMPDAAGVAAPFPQQMGGMGMMMMGQPNMGMMNPMMGMPMGGAGMGGMTGMGMGMGMPFSGQQGAPGSRMQGRIKSFNAKQGFGFIECAEAHAMFGRDIFLHKAQIGDLKVGAEITFSVESNKQGMPQARELLTLDGQPPGAAPQGGVMASNKTQRSGPQRGGRGGGGRGGGGRGRGGGAGPGQANLD